MKISSDTVNNYKLGDMFFLTSRRHYEGSDVQIERQGLYNFSLSILDIVRMKTDSPELKKIYGSPHKKQFRHSNKKLRQMQKVLRVLFEESLGGKRVIPVLFANTIFNCGEIV